MARVKLFDIEVEAKTVRQAIILLDKAVQYMKILQTEASAMMSCPVCQSYDIEPISPSLNRCRVCHTEIEYIQDEPT